MDYGRKQDLEMLAQGIKEARSVAERQHYEKIAYQIMNQSTTITSLRNELIAAFRKKDLGKVKRLQDHINAVRLDETRGTSWGQNKAEARIRA